MLQLETQLMIAVGVNQSNKVAGINQNNELKDATVEWADNFLLV